MTKTGVKRKTSTQTDSDSKVMMDALKLLQSSVNVSSDPYYTFAVNLANDLRKYDPYTLAHVKRAISNVLFDADMGVFSSSIQNDLPSPAHVNATSIRRY